jgi:hypothetical protein
VRRGVELTLRQRSGAKLVLLSLALGAIGTLPLLLYIQFGPADGNPIGLGLLAVATIPIAGFGLLFGLVRMVVELLLRERS